MGPAALHASIRRDGQRTEAQTETEIDQESSEPFFQEPKGGTRTACSNRLGPFSGTDIGT